MEKLNEMTLELIRLALVAVALLISWSGIWKTAIPVDIVAIVATLLGGYPIFKEAVEAIRERKMTMELSMSIALVATLLIGQFFTGLVIVFFVLIAELIEHLTVESGRHVIEKLVNLLPREATVRRHHQEYTIAIRDLAIDDIVIIKPGTCIPVDGIVLKGCSSVDQSSITGESLLAHKMEGSNVFAGTINQSGILEVTITRIGKETTFGKIIAIIEDAEKSRAPIQKTADKLSARLVYFAFAGALLTFLMTHDIVSAISALIVAGACGVAAGTPLAILAGIGRTAKAGIIVKGGIHLETLGSVDTIVLDKTGTLTLGKPQVVAIEAWNGRERQDVLRLAAGAEQHSEHPLADAILKAAREENCPIPMYSSVRYFPGKGMRCQVNQDDILVGNLSLLEAHSISIDDALLKVIAEKSALTQTHVLVVQNKQLIGIIMIADVIRDDARQAVDALKQLGCRVMLATGDSNATAQAVGQALGVDEIKSDMLPHHKLELIRRLIRSGKKVAMVGDGINDAPALVEASVGIAMGRGTDVALESADMVLSTNHLTKIVEAVKISRQCRQVILFNFWGTIVVDTIGITLAFFGHLSPLPAALIHVGSELTFILNSARLFRGKKF